MLFRQRRPAIAHKATKDMSQLALAHAVIVEKRIWHNIEAGAFMVKGSDSKVYAIKIFPKEQCSCPSVGTCYHIIAAKLSIGLEITSVKRTYNLTQLKRNSRSRVDKKSGRKKPRPNDCDIEIVPASDSKVITNDVKTKATGDIENTGSMCHEFDVENKSSVSNEVDVGNKRSVSNDGSNGVKKNDCDTDKLPRKRTKLPRKTHIEQPQTERKHYGYWLKELDLSISDKQIVSNGKWLTDKHIRAAQLLLKNQCPDIGGFQSTLLAPHYVTKEKRWINNCGIFDCTKSKAVQVHYTGNHHWVSSFINDENEVFVLDSLLRKDKTYITPSLQIQLAQIYKGLGSIEVKVPHVFQQRNGSDCGVFAIACMTEFCLNNQFSRDLLGGDIRWTFDSDKIRDHLIKCLEEGAFSPFPKQNVKRNVAKITDITIDLFCCGLPECYSDMIACDKCESWFHMCCIGEKCVDDNLWFCSNCT